MQRSHKTRQAGGALVLALALVVSVLAGAVGGSAQADDPTPSPAEEATPTADASPTAPADTDASDSATGGLGKQLAGALDGGPVDAVPDSWVIRRGLWTSVNVAANDFCAGGGCTYAVGQSVPAGWRVTVSSSGTVSFKPPADATPRRYAIFYRATKGPDTDESYLYVNVTPDSFGASSKMVFSHPYRKRYRYKIRNRILRSINSVPSGERIQVASWSFSSKAYRQALNKARKRGVIVQIVLAERNRLRNSSYGQLRKRFGTTVTPDGNWVKKCDNSCRGVIGTQHAKIFLFSKVYRTPYVMMTGSANLTDFAYTNQWNQMNTVSGSGNKAIYDDGVRIFTEMTQDRPAPQMYVESAFGAVTNIYYPATRRSTSTDYLYKAFNRVQCRGARNTSSGRTEIRIAVYAWYQDRGKWLAKQVRKLWNEGCKISIVYAVSSDPVKKILFSPTGRGRIPMRQILLTNRNFQPIYYVHDKWVAIRGHYAGKASNAVALQGSFNFSNLGFGSDESIQALYGSGYHRAFARNFKLLWKSPHARAPSPMSKFPTIEGRYSRDDLRLGTGLYRYMEAD